LEKLKTKLQGLKKPVDQATANQVGKEVVAEMKSMISKGISPIFGNGRFPTYKNPKRYPGDIKSRTPVNLKLTGDFQDSLRFTTFVNPSGFGTRVGYDGDKEQLKEQGHREGVNGQPKRPTIPNQDSGERFASRIELIYTRIYKRRIADLLKK
jgi:hypothetical protein